MTETSIPYPELVFRSLELAAQWHMGQWRKHPDEKIPYIAHPAGVGLLLARHGYDDEVVSAGILHDVIEDCGVTKEDLAEATTPRVADLVAWVSEPPKTVDVEERKAQYREQLADAPVDALAIKACDCIANLGSLLRASQATDEVWALFHQGREAKLAHEHAVLDIVTRRLDGPLAEMHQSILEHVESIP